MGTALAGGIGPVDALIKAHSSTINNSMVSYYTVKDTDMFKARSFPHVSQEVTVLREGLAPFPAQHKADIVLSYLKDHCIRIEWITANPTLVTRVTGRALQTTHIESLFEAAKKNKAFLHEFEGYMKHEFETGVIL